MTPADDTEIVSAARECSPATVGSAPGAGLETDEAVREAAYTFRPDRPLAVSEPHREVPESGEYGG